MLVRLRHVRKLSPTDYRVTLDLADPDREDWEFGDCTVRLDVHDGHGHKVTPRGLLQPALDAFTLARQARPEAADSRLLWEIGQAVDAFVQRLFEAGIVCPFQAETPADTPELPA